MNAEWRAVLTDAFEPPHRELGIEIPLAALVSLVMTFNPGSWSSAWADRDRAPELIDWIDALRSR